MPKWQHPHARYSTVKRGDKWSVLEEEPGGSTTYLGEYDTESDASKEMYFLMRQGVALRQQATTPEYLQMESEKKKKEMDRANELVESRKSDRAERVHKARLFLRKRELTKHQQRRNERSP